jgi:glycerophosphoryl diester phosphodiesterase
MPDVTRQRALRRIGHMGADHIAPGNTIASFEAALAAGVDMIEFDVLSEHPDGTGRLLLAHDYRDAKRPAALAWGLTYRTALPRYAAKAISDGRVDALMANWRLVTPGLVRHIHAAGGELYAWTVDDAGSIARLEAMGVDGVISNDPRLFEP